MYYPAEFIHWLTDQLSDLVIIRANFHEAAFFVQDQIESEYWDMDELCFLWLVIKYQPFHYDPN